MRTRFVAVVDGVEKWEAVFKSDSGEMVMQEALKALAHMVVLREVSQDRVVVKMWRDGVEQTDWDREAWVTALSIMNERAKDGI